LENKEKRHKQTNFWAVLVILFLFIGVINNVQANSKPVITGASQPEQYLDLLKGKSIGLVVNQTSTIENELLVDFLIRKQMSVKTIFAPEHGFRGEAGAGETISNSKDTKTGVSIVSIYGKNKKPTSKQLEDIDVIVFDIQDVGCRFYTYISTLHYVMEACAENHKKLVILDRPNPNGDYTAGPVLKPTFKSFVGLDPIPVVHGCTIGELALMINGERWLNKGVQTDLEIIKIGNYTHKTLFDPPIKPSPNLPNQQSIRLYPSLCFFEATSVSVGRGTEFPFQVLGYPNSDFGRFTFTPKSITGMDLNPPQKDKLCYGDDLRSLATAPKFTLTFFIQWLNKFKKSDQFLTRASWFNLLMGNDTVLKLILEGKDEAEISKSWAAELANYRSIRKKYLLYSDFK